MPKSFCYRNTPMPQHEIEMFLLDMESVDQSLRSLIQDHNAGEIRITKDVASRLRAMIQVFDRYRKG